MSQYPSFFGRDVKVCRRNSFSLISIRLKLGSGYCDPCVSIDNQVHGNMHIDSGNENEKKNNKIVRKKRSNGIVSMALCECVDVQNATKQ